MTFTTVTFAIFLLIVFTAHWCAKKRGTRNAILLVASYIFYGWWDWRFCLLMLFSCSVDFTIARAMDRSSDEKLRKILITSNVIFNVGLLGFFKYFGFFIHSTERMLHSLGFTPHLPTLQVILPVGMSFYTFQTLGYVLDVYHRQLRACRNLRDYLSYTAFFPQLVAGPIERAGHLLPQMTGVRFFDPVAASDGCRLILWGVFKKLAFADNFATFADQAYHNPGAYNGAQLLLGTLFFALQIYCDFSAYSDIARGLAPLFGFQLMRNFAYPYFSRSLTEFWRRWHISLSTWFRDYLFIPLGGSRCSAARSSANLILTFAISGLWHGAAWTYVIWGLLNGVALVVERTTPLKHYGLKDTAGSDGILPKPGECIRILCTFAFVCLTWVFFRASSVSQALLILEKIFSPAFFGPTQEFARWSVFSVKTVLLMIPLFLTMEWCFRRYDHPFQVANWPILLRWTLYTGIIWATIYMMHAHGGQFIYFQF